LRGAGSDGRARPCGSRCAPVEARLGTACPPDPSCTYRSPPLKAARALHDAGQSLWPDNITRGLLASGTLALQARAGRPDPYVKIPGMPDDLPAIGEAAIAGVPVKVRGRSRRRRSSPRSGPGIAASSGRLDPSPPHREGNRP
jgi:hypothetical protein